MAIYGYARVSTTHQDLPRQITNICTAYPNIEKKNIYKDKYTGTTIDRPAFMRLLSIVREGDTIVFDSVSRMSRNAAEGFKLYCELVNSGVQLVFLNEEHMNTAHFLAALDRNRTMFASTVCADTGKAFLNDFISGEFELLKRLMLEMTK